MSAKSGDKKKANTGRMFGNKFIVKHKNGNPLKGRYFVLNLDSVNATEKMRSRKAMQVYIQQAVETDPTYAIKLLQFYTDSVVPEGNGV